MTYVEIALQIAGAIACLIVLAKQTIVRYLRLRNDRKHHRTPIYPADLEAIIPRDAIGNRLHRLPRNSGGDDILAQCARFSEFMLLWQAREDGARVDRMQIKRKARKLARAWYGEEKIP